jgi:eukaryotic-like serine/threonine-protein kinase
VPSSKDTHEQTQETKPTKGTAAADLFETHGFVTPANRESEDKEHQLASSRMKILCFAGAVLFPAYALLDMSSVKGEISPGELSLIVALRLAAGVVFGVMGWVFHRWKMSRRALRNWTITAFVIGAALTSLIVAVTWDVVPDYYIGIGQLIIVRCVLLPGGAKLAARDSLPMIAAFPLGLLAFSGHGLDVFTGISGERVIAALSGLGGLTAVGLIGSYVYDKALQGTVVLRLQDRYRLDEYLDQGGFGKVFKAWDTLLGRPCALKLIPADEGEIEEKARLRFEQEARKTSQLRGSHVIDIFDYGTTFNGDLFYAMEYLDGMDLTTMVRDTGPLPAERVIYLGRQACLGLAEAHRQGLLHRDVKPANLFVTHRDETSDFLLVLDFGLVKAAADAARPAAGAAQTGEDDDGETTALTKAGFLIGTPQYLAPEQILDGIADARVDVYALGAVLYFMLTGREAFVASSQKKVLAKIVKGPPPPASKRAPGLAIPADLEAVIQRCMAFYPEDRYQTMGALRAALEQCAAAGDWSEPRAVAFWREHRSKEKDLASGPASAEPVASDVATAAIRPGVPNRP